MTRNPIHSLIAHGTPCRAATICVLADLRSLPFVVSGETSW